MMKSEKQKLETGQFVKWQTTPKHQRKGKIVFVVPQGQSPNWHNEIGAELLKFLQDNIYNKKCVSALSDGGQRNHESYLVLVSHPKNGKPTIYWPRVDKLEKTPPIA